MKKALTLLFAAALVCAFAVPAMADAGKYLGAANFTFKTQIWQWGTSQDNTNDFDDDMHDKRHFVQQRLRFWLNSDFGDYGAVLGLEGDWGWGQDDGVPGGSQSTGGTSPKGDDLKKVEYKRAYIWFNVPATPIKVSAGLGVQGGVDPNNLMFGGNDYFGVRLDMPLGESFTLSGAWLKIDEGGDNPVSVVNVANQDRDNNETNLFYIDLKGSLGKMLSFGTYHFWMHCNEDGAFTLDEGAGYGGFLGSRQQLTLSEGDYFWHGFHAKLNAGIFYAQGHFNYFWGDPEDDTVTAEPSGWGALAGAGIKPGPFKIGMRFWYFTGNEYEENGEWDRWSSFNSFFAPLELFGSGYRSWATGLTGNESTPGGHAFIGLDLGWTVTKKLSFDVLAGYLWWTDDMDKPTNALATDEESIGFEIDAKLEYKMYDHLQLTLGVAYLFAGEGLDHFDGAGGIAEADDAYELFWRLYYSF
jgi:hypothetical protein